MANLYAYVEVVKSGQKYTGEPPEIHEGETLTGVYRVAPAFSASTATLPSIGTTASTDIWAEVLVTTHIPAPSVQSGSSAGTPVVRKFPFAYNTSGLLTGAALYTPTVDDVLIAAWIVVLTAWDGTTPKGDIGTFVGSTTGLFNGGTGVTTMSDVDAESKGAGVLLPQGRNVEFAGAASTGFNSWGEFTATHPIKVCVSTTGATDGADPGSTQGAAILYLVTAHPSE